jgi:hypothetical protein
MQYKITTYRWVINPLETFSHFGMVLTDHNCMPEAIKSGLNWGNTSYHSVQYILSCRLLSKTINIEMYRTIFCLLFYMGAKLRLSHEEKNIG